MRGESPHLFRDFAESTLSPRAIAWDAHDAITQKRNENPIAIRGAP